MDDHDPAGLQLYSSPQHDPPPQPKATTTNMTAAPNVPAQPARAKRRQVKNACTHCQKACKKCDDARPCLRCVKYGCAEDCVDSQRKERRKGVKRGPYKKRDGKSESSPSSCLPVRAAPASALARGMIATIMSPI